MSTICRSIEVKNANDKVNFNILTHRYHFINTALFSISYITMIVIQKTLFYNYTHKLLSLDNMQIIDTIFLSGYLYIFRPRKFPEYFDIGYAEESVEYVTLCFNF
jgi:hypothetical protein